MEKLPEDFKRKWLEALRSGEYKQGQCSLHQADGTHCCIGVAELACEQNEIYRFIDKSIGEKTTWRIIHMNDSENKSFLEIADWIEENL